MAFQNGYGDDYYQNAGFKGLERYDITVRVISCIDLMGDLYAALRFTGINDSSHGIFVSFIREFFKTFHITAGLLKEDSIPLITDIETSFSGSLDLTPEIAGKFLTHFEDYLHALKEAGVYDPSVMKQIYNPAAAWERSV